MLRRNILTTVLVLLPSLAACNQASSPGSSSQQSPSAIPASSQQTATSGCPSGKSEIIMGLIPAENNQEMAQKFEPMRAYMEKQVGCPIKVFQATDYAGIIEAMKKDRVDLAWLGPLSYILAEQEAGAEVFAVGVRENGKSTYRSLFIVPGDSPIKSLEDLKGKTVAFVDPASTSGALVPTYLVKKKTGQMPQEFFGKLTYAGTHDAAELAIKNKTVEAAADNDITYEKMLAKGLITKESNRILLQSDLLPGSPLVYRNDLDSATKQKIKTAVLTAHKDIKVTGYGNIIRYDAAIPADYQAIRDMVKELGLRREQMAK